MVNGFVSSGLVAELAERQTQTLVERWMARVECGKAFDPLLDLAETVSSFIYSLCYGKAGQ